MLLIEFNSKNKSCLIRDFKKNPDFTGASSGFQPNQGKNTKFQPVIKIISYKRCLKILSVYFRNFFYCKKLSRFGYVSIKVQAAYNIMIFFLFLMENSIQKIFGSMDVKITPDFSS